MKPFVTITFEQNLGEYPWELRAMAISSDGRSLAIAIEDAQLVLWDMRTFQKLSSSTLPANVQVLAWSDDGEFLAALLEDGTVWMETNGGEEIGLVLSDEGAWTLAFLPGTSLLITRLTDGQLHLWDILPARLLLSKRWSEGETQSMAGSLAHRPGLLACSQNGDLLAVEARAREERLEIWRLMREDSRWFFHPLRAFSALARSISALQYRPGTSQVFVSTGEAIWGWDVEIGQQTAKISLPRVHHAAFCFSPHGDRLAIADGRGILRIWDFSKREVIAQCAAHTEGWVPSAPFLPIFACFWLPRQNSQQEVILTGGWSRWQYPEKVTPPVEQETAPLYWSTAKRWQVKLEERV